MKKGLVFVVLMFCTLASFAQLSIVLDYKRPCPNQNDGKIWATVTGGTPPYEYAWNGGTYGPSDTAFNISSGSKYVSVRDALGVIASKNQFVSVISTNTVNSSISNHDLTICPNNEIDLRLSLYTSSGAAYPYILEWGNGTSDTLTNTRSFVKTLLAPQDITLKVTQGQGCMIYDTFHIVPMDTFQTYLFKEVINCALNHCVVAIPGSDSYGAPYLPGPFTYEWADGTRDSTNCDPFGLDPYSITVTSSGGCTSTASIVPGNMWGMDYLGTNITPATCGAMGSAEVQVQGGVPPYQVVWYWNNGFDSYTGNPFVNIPPGSYDVEIYDSEWCMINQYVNIPVQYANNQMDVEDTVIYDICGGTACIDVSFPNMPAGGIVDITWHDYFWSNTYGNSPQLCVNTSGAYVIDVYTLNGCLYQDTFIINLASPLVGSVSSLPATCANDGSVICNVTGGLPPVNILWSNGATTDTVSNLPAGNYSVTATDAQGCTYSANVNITSSQMLVDSVGSWPGTCATTADGSAYVSVTGTNGPFNYNWSNGATTSLASNILPGINTVTVTDANNCSLVQTVAVQTVGLQLQTSVVSYVSCAVNNSGVAMVSPLNGYAPYTYQWSNGTTNDTATGLIVDAYNVTVTDDFGCTAATQQNIGLDPGCTAILSGKVYTDADSSCAYNTGDAGIPNKVVVIDPGYVALTDNQGNWQVQVRSNQTYKAYVSTVGIAAGSICGVDTLTIPVIDSTAIANLDFPREPLLLSDVEISFVCGVPRPGFFQTLYFEIANNGIDTASGTGTITLDTILGTNVNISYLYGVHVDSVSSTVPAVVYFSYSALPPYSSIHFSLNLVIPTIPTVSLGQPVNYSATITLDSATDQVLTNNNYSCSRSVAGAYDPNDKQVFSQSGQSIDGPTSVNDSVFIYHIRFQNTGTDTAFNVLVKDTLGPNLDITTFQLLATSHPVDVQFKYDSIIHFVYDNILLPDSNVNEPGSHGFVRFQIALKDPGQLQEVTNQASIFFDYNPPIYTNTVATQRNYYPCLYPAGNFETVFDQTICNGDTYWGYVATGTYRDTFVLSAGCDSVRVLNLTVLPPNVVAYSQTICAGLSFEGHSSTGTYYDTLTAANGCDSVRVLSLIVSNTPVTVIDETVCFGGTYLGYGTSGTYYDTLSAASGCDSVRQLNLTVLPQNTTSLTQSICAGQQFEGYSATGVYTDTLTAANGCDSIRVLDLTVGNAILTVLNETVCFGDSYLGYGISGTYYDTLSAASGCDSVRQLNLTVLPQNTTSLTQTICAGQQFEGYSATGVYTDTLTAANGCDSIRVLDLTVGNAILTVLTETVCFGDSYLGYITSGTFYDTLAAASGCDSVRQLNLTVLPSISTTLNAAICDGDSIYVGGASQTISGTYTDILASATGCDSIVETILTVNALPTAPQIVQNGSELSVDATGLTAFQWYLDGTALPNETNSALTVAANGTYHVEVSDANSCSSTSGTIQVTGVSVNEIAQFPLSIFPNPTTGKLSVNVGGAVVERLELYNALGQQLNVMVSNIGTGQVDVDASEFASGVYMVRILSAGAWQQERVVIAK